MLLASEPVTKLMGRLVSGGLLLVLATAVAGCEEYRARRDSVTFEHGNANAHNIAVQTIDPWPPASSNKRIQVDGERTLIGVQRYKSNTSIPPRGLSTQSINTQPGAVTGGGTGR